MPPTKSQLTDPCLYELVAQNLPRASTPEAFLERWPMLVTGLRPQVQAQSGSPFHRAYKRRLA